MKLVKDTFEVRKIEGTHLYVIGYTPELDEFAVKIGDAQ